MCDCRDTGAEVNLLQIHNTPPTERTMFSLRYLYSNTKKSYIFQCKISSSEKKCQIIMRKAYYTHFLDIINISRAVYRSQVVKHSSLSNSCLGKWDAILI